MYLRGAEGVSEAVYEWAKGFDPSMRLNASVESSEDIALLTSSGAVVNTFIDGTEERQFNFTLTYVAPWSEETDGLNEDALTKGESWLDWVSEQFPSNVPDLGGREVVDIDTDEEAPVQIEVFPDEQMARYQFLAHMTYRS